jgi:hypothetical protein
MKRPAVAAALPAVMVLVAACGERAGNQWLTEVERLDGGRFAVTNTPPAAEAPTWRLEEELRIGTVDGDGPASFGQIKGIEVDDAGRIIVLDAQARQVRVFGPDGAHLATHGGPGGGPGEYRNPLGLMQGSDGLIYLPDQQNARMSVLHPERGELTSHPMTLLSWGFIWDGAMRDDDHIIVPSMERESRRRMLRIYSLDMTQVDSAFLPEPPPGNAAAGSYAWEAPGGMPRGFVQVPWFATGARYIDRSGDIFSSFAGDPSYRVVRWRPEGDTTLVLQTQRAPVPVTAAERDSALNALVQNLSQYGVRTLDASRVPAHKPAVLSIFRDDQERLWVETTAPDGGVRHYDIYDRDGRIAGSLATSLRIYRWLRPQVRDGYLYALVTDEMDVQYIVRARIVENGAAERGT